MFMACLNINLVKACGSQDNIFQFRQGFEMGAGNLKLVQHHNICIGKTGDNQFSRRMIIACPEMICLRQNKINIGADTFLVQMDNLHPVCVCHNLSLIADIRIFTLA